MALSILAAALLALGLGLQSVSAVSREVQTDLVVQMKGQDLVDLMLVLPTGTPTDPDPTAEQLDEMFDGDDDPGTITLYQLSRAPLLSTGWEFSLTSFEIPGTWRVRADFDMNGDGLIGVAVPATAEFDESDQAAIAQMESDSKVFVLRVFFNDQLILMTNRQVEAS